MKNKDKTLDVRSLELFKPIPTMDPIFIGNGDDLYDRIIKEQNGKSYAEVKEDGYRLQVHKKGERIEGFTRNLNFVNMGQFPELKGLQKLPDCVLDCEIIGLGKGIVAYEEVKKRFRFKIGGGKLEDHLKSGIIEEHPMRLSVFDTLYWNDEFIVNNPLRIRRTFTEVIDEPRIQPSKMHVVGDADSLRNLFISLTGDNYEGLVCKNPESLYIPGDTREWIKVKRFETLDLAVLGVYFKEGRMVELLCGTRNKGHFETLTKVNAKTNGLDKVVDGLLKRKYIKKIPPNVVMNPLISPGNEDYPTYFVNPDKSVVVEVSVLNFQYGKNCYSCGLKEGNAFSVRIPVLKRMREDKCPEKATTTDKIKGFYEAERKS